MSSKILLRRGTATQWSSANPILGNGELGIETDTLKIKIGNGTSTWSQLTSYANITPSELTSAINSIIDLSPSTLDTLNELAAAINDDPNFFTSVNTSLSDKASLTSANTFTGGVQQITTASATTVGLIIKGVTGQTANIQEWYNSNNVLISWVRRDGLIAGQIQSPTIYQATVVANGSTSIPLIVRGFASQTADLQQWQDSAGNIISRISSAGSIFASTSGTRLSGVNGDLIVNAASATVIPIIARGFTSQSANLQEWQSSGGTPLAKIDHTGSVLSNYFTSRINLTNAYLDMTTDSVKVTNRTASSVPFIVKGAASQTANLQEWQDSTGAVLSYITASGALRINSAFGGTQVAITAGSAATVGAIVRGAASQTANLQQWQNSGESVLSYINASGQFISNVAMAVLAGNYGGYVSQFISSNPSYKGILVKGAASQTENLQEWQNSGGTVQNKIGANGNFLAIGAVTVNQSNTAQVGENYGIGAFEVKGTSFMIPRAATGIGLIIRGFASQTADLTEWQDNAGTTLAEVKANGDIFTATKIGTTSSTPNIFGVVYGSGSANTYAEGSFSTNSGFASPVVFPNEEGWYPYFSYRVPDIVETSDDGITWTNRAPMEYAGLFSYQPSYNVTTYNRYLRITMNQPTYTFLGLAVARFYYGTNNRSHTMKTELLNSSGGVIATYGPTAGTNVYDGAILAQKFNSYNGSTTATRITIENTQFVAGDNFTLSSLMTYLSKPGTGKSFQSKFPMSWNLYKTTTFQPTQPGSKALIVKAKNQSVSISNAVGDGTTITFTTTTNNEFISGSQVTISGIDPSPYNLGLVTIASVPTGNTFTVTNSATGTYVSGGTASIAQSVNIQEWQDSSGGVNTYVDQNQHIFTANGRAVFLNTGYLGNTSFASSSYAPNRVAIIAKAAASQTANIQEWQNSAGTVLANVNSTGEVRAPLFGAVTSGKALLYTAASATNEFRIDTNTSANKGLVIRGAPSQTANLQEWQNSSSQVMSRIGSDAIFRGYTADITNLGKIIIQGYSATDRPLVIQGAASQTANLQEWQDSTGTVLAKITATGDTTFGYTYISGVRDVNGTGAYINMQSADGVLLNTRSASNRGLVIKGSSSQTAALLEFVDSNNNSLGAFNSNGLLYIGSINNRVSFNNSRIQLNNNGLLVDTGVASNVALTVQSTNASQTGDLQQWKNSTGTVLAKISAAGAIDVTAITVNGSPISTSSIPAAADVELMSIMGAY